MFVLGQSSLVCPHFTEEGVEREKIVFLGAIKVFEDFTKEGQKSGDLVIGCNRFRNCEDLGCLYSGASRQEQRRKREEKQK